MAKVLRYALTSVVCVGVGWYFAAPTISWSLLFASCLLGMAVDHIWHKVRGGSPDIFHFLFFLILVVRAGSTQPIKDSDFVWLALGTGFAYAAGFLLKMLYRFSRSS